MSNDINTTMVDLKFNMTREALEQRWDRSRNKAETTQSSLKAARVLQSMNLTIEMTIEHYQFGYKNIFEMIAGELHERGLNPIQKGENKDLYAAEYRLGFSSLRDQLLVEWSDTPLLMVPREVNDRNFEVITLNPEFVVNARGQTALEISQLREHKLMKGQVNASAKKLTKSIGSDKARQVLSRVIGEALTATDCVQPGTREAQLQLIEGVDQ